MRILHEHLHPERRAQALAILLPGALQRPEDLVQAGFVDAVRTRGLSMDLALADLQPGYVGEAGDGASLSCLHDAVVQPARHAYSQIWLAGISIGGFIALAYADRFPGCVDGLCLLAPYPGSRVLANEIEAAGGLEPWAAVDAGDDAERRVWRWLRSCRGTGLQMYFGYGRQDRFSCGQRKMAVALPGDCVDVVEGAHDWPAWKQLWDNFLDRLAQHPEHHNTDPVA